MDCFLAVSPPLSPSLPILKSHFSQCFISVTVPAKNSHYVKKNKTKKQSSRGNQVHTLTDYTHKQDYRRKRKAITEWWLAWAKKREEKNADCSILWEFLFPRRCWWKPPFRSTLSKTSPPQPPSYAWCETHLMLMANLSASAVRSLIR